MDLALDPLDVAGLLAREGGDVLYLYDGPPCTDPDYARD